MSKLVVICSFVLVGALGWHISERLSPDAIALLIVAALFVPVLALAMVLLSMRPAQPDTRYYLAMFEADRQSSIRSQRLLAADRQVAKLPDVRYVEVTRE